MTETNSASGLVAAALVLAIGGPVLAQDRVLAVTSWGGAYMASQREVYFKPFTAKTGIVVREAEYDGELPKIKAMVESGRVSWDIVDTTMSLAVRGCDQGLWEKLDYSRIGDRAGFVPGGALDCAVGSVIWSTVVAFDERRFPASGPQPQSIADFFDVVRFPGARALGKRPRVNLEMALMADGVPPGDVYRTLSVPEGVERAFRKLSTIKPFIKAWWDSGNRPTKLLADGEVVMTTVLNGRIAYAIGHEKRPFKIMWHGQVWDMDLWAIPKGARRLDLAYEFLRFASDPTVMAKQSQHVAYGPAHVEAIALVDPRVLPLLPNAPENFAHGLQTDARFWAARQDELAIQFANWLAR